MGCAVAASAAVGTVVVRDHRAQRNRGSNALAASADVREPEFPTPSARARGARDDSADHDAGRQ